MKFYHSTSKWHLNAILESGKGLFKGDVPITPRGGFNAVWLSDRVSEKKSWMYLERCSVNKSEVLIEVDICEDDPSLKKWTDVMVEHRMDKKWADALNRGNDWQHWYVYLGEVNNWEALTIDGERHTRGKEPRK